MSASAKEPNRFHDNLIVGLASLDCSRPLNWNDPVHSPRVYPRPTNIRQIVSWRGRIKAAWLVLTLNAVALRWYDDDNADQYGRCWDEWVRTNNRLAHVFTEVASGLVPRIKQGSSR